MFIYLIKKKTKTKIKLKVEISKLIIYRLLKTKFSIRNNAFYVIGKKTGRDCVRIYTFAREFKAAFSKSVITALGSEVGVIWHWS